MASPPILIDHQGDHVLQSAPHLRSTSAESPYSNDCAVFDSQFDPQFADQSPNTSPSTTQWGSPQSTGNSPEPLSNLEHLALVALVHMATSDVPQGVLKERQYYDRIIYNPTLFAKEHGAVYITAVLADVLEIKKDTQHNLAPFSDNIDVLVSQSGFVWQLETVDRATCQVLDFSSFWQNPETKEQAMDRCALTLLADYSNTKCFTAAEWLKLMVRSGTRPEMVYYSKHLHRSYTLSDILGTDKKTQEFHFSIQKDGKTLAALKSSRRSRNTRWAPY